jgi:hypothetical protein
LAVTVSVASGVTEVIGLKTQIVPYFGGACAKCPAEGFRPHPLGSEPEVEDALIELLGVPYQEEPPIKHFKTAEVQEVISNLYLKK